MLCARCYLQWLDDGSDFERYYDIGPAVAVLGGESLCSTHMSEVRNVVAQG